MAKLTQLNLQGTSDGKSSPESRRAEKHSRFSGRQKNAAFAGSVILTALLGVVLLQAGGCSHDSHKPVTLTESNQPITSSGALNPPATTVGRALPAPKTAPKKLRQRKLSAATYTNLVYGISFRYPEYDNLKEGNRAEPESNDFGPGSMNFIQPGGTELTAVTLPGSMYPGTDLNSAFFNVSVDTKLTPAECEQFAFAEAKAQEGSGAAPKDASSVTSLGTAEFTEVANADKDAHKYSDAKYYHVFQNGACYEFMLGLETAGNGADGVKPVNHNEVFRKLNWMLSTVKIQAAGVPAKTAPEVSAGVSTTAAEAGKN